MLPGRTYTLDDIAVMIRRREWVIVIPTVLASLATVAVLGRLPDRFRSDTLILVVPQRVPESYVKATVTTRIEDRLQTISQQLLSRTRLERTILDFDLYRRERQSSAMEDVVERMRANIKVQIVKGDAFRVSYVADTPALAQKVTERLSSLFIEENLRDREVLAEATNEFLETQLADARRRLIEQEKQLEQYRMRHAGELPSQLQANLQGVQNLQTQVQGLIDSINRDRDRRLVLERTVIELESRSREASPPSTPAELSDRSPTEQLEALRQSLAAMEVRLRPQHPDMVRTKRLIHELEEGLGAKANGPEPPVAAGGTAAIRSTPSRRVESLGAEIQTLDLQIADKEQRRRVLVEQIARYDARIAVVPARESELASRTRDYETLQKVYTDLLSKREQSQVAANLERRQIGEQFSVLDPARLPEKPFSPNRPLFLLIGLVAGLTLGAGLAGWLEYRDTSLRSDADVSATLALPVLARVPVRPSVEQPRDRIRDLARSFTAGTLGRWRDFSGRRRDSRSGTGKSQAFSAPPVQPLVVTHDSYVEASAGDTTAGHLDPRARGNLIVASDAGDAYCRLAAELHQAGQSRPLTTLIITSAEPGEGKSLTAANLALALSTSYRKRVLLVDADLRRPSLQALFGADDAPGLSDCLLAGGRPLVQPLRLSGTLSLLPAGYPEANPLATLTSSRMKDLLSEQAQHFDWVIVDAPPLVVFPDAHLLASLANGIVLVVAAGQTPLAAVESAVKMVGRERLVGIVLNRSAPTPRTYYERQARRVGLIQRCSRFFCRA
jgi:polysaccharide chain length determinant protein (PEP-CTERM system associated)